MEVMVALWRRADEDASRTIRLSGERAASDLSDALSPLLKDENLLSIHTGKGCLHRKHGGRWNGSHVPNVILQRFSARQVFYGHITNLIVQCAQLLNIFSAYSLLFVCK
jgi:hypothetical protein